MASIRVEDLVAKAGVVDIDQECSNEDTLPLSDLCDPWELVGRFLKLSQVQIRDIDRDVKTTDLKRLTVLQKWRESYAFKATFRELVSALISSKRVDAAQKVCQYLAEKQARSKLDQVIDSGNESTKELGRIARSMYEWEGCISDELELSPADVAAIKTKYPFDLNLQAKEALVTWKRNKGPAATFNNLIKVFESASYLDYAEVVKKIGMERASNSSGGASGIGPSASQTSLAPKRSDIVTPKHLQLIKWKDENGETQKLFLLTEISPRWRDIGGRIDLTFAELANIETEFPGKSLECCRSVLRKWLDKPPPDYPATWDGLIELLEDCVPSGHVMISTAVLLTCVHYIASDKPTTDKSKTSTGPGRTAPLWYQHAAILRTCVFALAMAIGLTRILISSHFIHQVILGLLAGWALDKVSSHCNLFLSNLQWTLTNSWKNLLIMSVFLLFGGIAIYYGMIIAGLDPEFSVALATKYCQERSWVHPDTTPFYSLMRSTGALLGMGVVSLLAERKLVMFERLWSRNGVTDMKRVIGLTLSLLVVSLVHSKYTPSFAHSGDVIFYTVAIIKAAIIPFVTFVVLVFLE